ncbi:hypothetical protein [Paenarthrobacter sp. PH39-S1]|uniref:hypothetical protein n=1 Tax=Paenarthrobacter sp. PH39-S1 TaxID=3046204 RepID=UPI0024BB9270|nr:hypothetical protein [Paenarthrobacter sp. PH39-S1]MDJ0358226.1 hypothetical protein [Paenarthrobacter sp. PH39-S1]
MSTKPRADPSAVIPPLAAIDTIGHSVVDDAAGQLGLFRGQVCALVKRYRQGAEMVTDLAAG